MHCILNYHSGFKQHHHHHMDPAQYEQREMIHSLKPNQIYPNSNLDYWNCSPRGVAANTNMREYTRNHNDDDGGMVINKGSPNQMIFHREPNDDSFRSNSSPSGSYYYYPPPAETNSADNSRSPNNSSNDSSSNSNAENHYSHQKRRSSGSSTKSGHPIIQTTGNSESSNSLELLTRAVNKFEPPEVDNATTDELYVPNQHDLQNYRRGSLDRFHRHRHSLTPPSPPPHSPGDSYSHKSPSSSFNNISGHDVHDQEEPEVNYDRRHSFTSATTAGFARLRLNTLDGNHQNQHFATHPYNNKNHKIYSSSYCGPSNNALFHEKRHSLHTLPTFQVNNAAAQAHNSDKELQPEQFLHNKRRESVSSLSDDNHYQSHDEANQHSDDSNPESHNVDHDKRRDSDASLTAIENDPAAFLFLGPCGKKRRIIRERQISEPSVAGTSPSETPTNNDQRRCSLQDTTKSSPPLIIKQEPADIIEDKEEEADELVKPREETTADDDTPLNLCTSGEASCCANEAMEKVKNLSINCRSEAGAMVAGIPLHYYEHNEQRRGSASSLHGKLMGLEICGEPEGNAVTNGYHLQQHLIQQEVNPLLMYNNKERRFSESSTGSATAEKGEKKKLKCPDCPKEFSQLRNFRYHRSKHEGTETFACTCPVCGKHFNDKGYLSSHLKIHRNAKEYHCEWCPKSFNQRVAYNMHIRIHTGLKPHQCTVCPKSFSRKMLLRQHLRTHTGERPYQCEVCSKCFADRSNMLLHKRLHSGERPYKCQECSKTFSKNHHLKTHMNHHAGIKPYQCEKCKACFSQSSNMKTHFRKCTGNGLALENNNTISPSAMNNMTQGSNGVTIPLLAKKEKASPGRPPKSKFQKQPSPHPADHVSVISHTNYAPHDLFLGNPEFLNRRRSTPNIEQRNFYESHFFQQQQQQLQHQQQLDELEQSSGFRKHSSSFSGRSSFAPRVTRPLMYHQEPRLLSASNNQIDLHSAIQFSLSRVESSPLARLTYGHQQPLQPIVNGRHGIRHPYFNMEPNKNYPLHISPPQIVRTPPSPLDSSAYDHHIMNPPPPPSPTGEILRNSLLNKSPLLQHPYNFTKTPPATDDENCMNTTQGAATYKNAESVDDAESPIIVIKREN